MDSDYLECNVDVTFILFKTLEFVKNLETFRTAAARVDEINPNTAARVDEIKKIFIFRPYMLVYLSCICTLNLFDCIYSEISDIFSSQRIYAPRNRTFQSRDEFAWKQRLFAFVAENLNS